MNTMNHNGVGIADIYTDEEMHQMLYGDYFSQKEMDRLLYVFAKNGELKCHYEEELRTIEAELYDMGWKHTATIEPARWIEAMANGHTDPSDMLDELQFSGENK